MQSTNTVEYPTLSCKSRCAREASPSIIFSTDTACTRLSLSLLSLSLLSFSLSLSLSTTCFQSLQIVRSRRSPTSSQTKSGANRHTKNQSCKRTSDFASDASKEYNKLMSRDMRFPTMWYVRPAKPHISLRICTV